MGTRMRPGDIPRALEPFGQIDSSLARKYQVTGLGLSSARKLTVSHGGGLLADYESDASTTVRQYCRPIVSPL